MKNLRLLVVAATVLLSSVQGCAPAPQAPPVDPARLVGLFRNYQADYLVMSKPSDLERISHVVLTGQVAEVREGRIWQVPSAPWTKSTSVILAVEREKVLGGKERIEDSRVYVELENPGRLPLTEYQGALPAGSRVILYLSKAGSKADTPDIASANGNEAIDSKIYLPVSPQGFGVDSKTSVVWPIAGVTLKGSLEESYPGGSTLPQE